MSKYFRTIQQLKTLVSVMLILIAIFDYFPFSVLISFVSSTMLSIVLMFLGLFVIYKFKIEMQGSLLLYASIFFNLGLIIFLVDNFELRNIYKIQLTILFYFVGTGMLLLNYFFQRSNKNKIVAFVFICLTILSFYYKSTNIYSWTNQIVGYLYEFKSIAFMTAGIILLSKRK